MTVRSGLSRIGVVYSLLASTSTRLVIEVHWMWSGLHRLHVLQVKWRYRLSPPRPIGDVEPWKTLRRHCAETLQDTSYNLRKKVLKAKSWLIASPRTSSLHFPSLILILSYVQMSGHQELL